MTWSPQYFKPNDAQEKQFDASYEPLISSLLQQKDLFYAGAYTAAPLGDLIFADLRAPLANAIPQEIFRSAFSEVFDAFVKVGTFEAYLTVFRKIFGTDVDVEFTVSAPGKLAIAIEAAGVELSNFIARYIASNHYFFDEVIDEDADNIAFQTVKGFQSQYDLEQMLTEMVPAGIFTTISLSLGE